MSEAREEEWGPWIEHDGKRCPVVGRWVEQVLVTDGQRPFFGGGHEKVMEKLAEDTDAWDWKNFGIERENGTLCPKIIRYRVRRPRALLDMIEQVEQLPAPTRQPEVEPA